MTEIVARVQGQCGELVLRRCGQDHEVIANGMFLMDTRNGESERLMVSVAAQLSPAPARMLIGGLGVGYSLRAALEHVGVGEIVVVEQEPSVIEWNTTGPLRAVHGGALADPRVTVVTADLVRWLRETSQRFDAVCVDIDNGPLWTVTEDNASLYSRRGLDLLAARMTPGGVLAVWSAQSSVEFASRLGERFGQVNTLEVPVPSGEPDVIWLVRV